VLQNTQQKNCMLRTFFTLMATSAAKLRRFGSTSETDDGIVSDDKTFTVHQYNQVITTIIICFEQ